MDPTSHIPAVTLFYYLDGTFALSDDDRDHLARCAYCQSVLDQYKTYVDPAMIRVA